MQDRNSNSDGCDNAPLLSPHDPTNDGVFSNISAKPGAYEEKEDDILPAYNVVTASPPTYDDLLETSGSTDEIRLADQRLGSYLTFFCSTAAVSLFQIMGAFFVMLFSRSHAGHLGMIAGTGIALFLVSTNIVFTSKMDLYYTFQFTLHPERIQGIVQHHTHIHPSPSLSPSSAWNETGRKSASPQVKRWDELEMDHGHLFTVVGVKWLKRAIRHLLPQPHPTRGIEERVLLAAMAEDWERLMTHPLKATMIHDLMAKIQGLAMGAWVLSIGIILFSFGYYRHMRSVGRCLRDAYLSM